MSKGLYEVLWIKRLLEELGYLMDTEKKMYCDNTVATIAIAHNLVQHDRTKHVKVNMHFIKQKLNKKIVMFCFFFNLKIT
jgi:hypothetical protein